MFRKLLVSRQSWLISPFPLWEFLSDRFTEEFRDFDKHAVSSVLATASCGLWNSAFQLENPFQRQPLLPRPRFWQSLLKLPHQLFPLLHFLILAVRLGFFLKRKTLAHFHDHEHSCPTEINFQVLDSCFLDAFRDLRPDFFVVTLIFGNQLCIVLQIERQAVASAHSGAPSFPNEALSSPGMAVGLYPDSPK